MAILRAITDAGFEIRYEKLDIFRPDDVESLYVKHRNQDYFPALVEAYTAYEASLAHQWRPYFDVFCVSVDPVYYSI